MNAMVPGAFNWKSPDYAAEFRKRLIMLGYVRAQDVANPDERAKVSADRVKQLKTFYRSNVAQFIDDWGVTLDPKNIKKGLPALVPFRLFPKQREWVDEVVAHWRAGQPFLTEKTRQMGFSWLAMAVASSLCILFDGMTIGVGSRKEEYVDKIGDPKCLFHKGRVFLDHLPGEFKPGWSSAHMRLVFENGSSITGEAGDNIGRGGTFAIYIVDESAFLARPELVDASLSQATDCRIDISTPNGMANPFYAKRSSGEIDVFTFHWRDDPRKDDAWYAEQVRTLDAIVVAQEIDIDYAASVEGVLIPSAWVQAAVDAHLKLGIPIRGERRGAFDVADEGKDKCSFVGGRGILIEFAEEWSGVGSDTFKSTEKVFDLCDDWEITEFLYDADGMGAPVRGDARVINERRKANNRHQLTPVAFRGSAGVFRPEAQDIKGRKNQDYFMNAKAQAWSSLRERFKMTYRAVVEGMEYDPDKIISISSKLKNLNKLTTELSQPTWAPNVVGKMVVDKAPEGVKSPNLADGAMMRYSEFRAPMKISNAAVNEI